MHQKQREFLSPVLLTTKSQLFERPVRESPKRSVIPFTPVVVKKCAPKKRKRRVVKKQIPQKIEPPSWYRIKYYNESPHQMISHSAVLKNDILFVFSGDSGRFFQVDLKTQKWKRILAPNTPSIRFGHSACVNGNHVYIFGGFHYPKFYNDVHLFDFETFRWSTVRIAGGNVPIGREYHSTVIYKDCMYVFGGEGSEGMLNDLFELNLRTRMWKQMDASGEKPSCRNRHSACVWKDFLIVFGGFDQKSRKHLNDLHIYDFKNKCWNQQITKGDVPSGRCGHSCVVRGDEMLLFGGFDGSDFLHDLYKLDLNEWIWKKQNRIGDIPSGRYQCSALINQNNQLYIFGGSSGNGGLNDLYVTTIMNEST